MTDRPITAAAVHALLANEKTLVGRGPVGVAYRAQVRRVRELIARLEAVDPQWVAAWQNKERGQNHER